MHYNKKYLNLATVRAQSIQVRIEFGRWNTFNIGIAWRLHMAGQSDGRSGRTLLALCAREKRLQRNDD